ncbi:hypothetical protein HUN58_09440 [Curtobacterium sp. Csp1]|uniref:O-antigen ligase family protein n=1 Tax=unclassified Curtobacterium TaxID=257496 RepID=UPI001599A92A|nr:MULTISPECIES: O-antigen ligase family protein [unclassified Curtobacterium]QKS12519.1 hypothetical protein HUN60_04730 [Curtobacterium sp. csp3]QKS20123.1 hypothetical protein HUN58_09440 [Curtobacterium sp. Csp1]
MTIALAAFAAAVAAVFIRQLCPPQVVRGFLISAAIGLVLAAGGFGIPVEITGPVIAAAVVLSTAAALVPGSFRASVPTSLTIGLWVAHVTITLALVFLGGLRPSAAVEIPQFAGVALSTVLAAARCTPRDVRFVRRAVVWFAVIESVLALFFVFVLGRPGVWEYGAETPSPNFLLGGEFLRAAGSVVHPLLLGLLIAFGAVLVLMDERLSGWTKALVLALLLLTLVVTGSRSVVLALSAAVVWLTMTAQRSRTERVLLLAVVAAVVAAVGSDDIAQAVAVLLDSGSYTNRAESIDSAPALLGRPVVQSLFGSGYGSELALRELGHLNQNGFETVDNQYVTTLATQGVLGLVALVALLATWFRNGDRTVRALSVIVVVVFCSFDAFRATVPLVLMLSLLTPGAPTTTAPTAPDATAPAALADDRPVRHRSRRTVRAR